MWCATYDTLLCVYGPVAVGLHMVGLGNTNYNVYRILMFEIICWRLR